jgi:hypothetical protein
MQDLVVYFVLGAAAGYLVWRMARRHGSGNCCGEKECPAAKNMVRNLERRAAEAQKRGS